MRHSLNAPIPITTAAPRPRRAVAWVRNGLTAVLLCASVGVAVMWYRSGRHEDVVSAGRAQLDNLPHRYRRVRIESFRGQLTIRFMQRTSDTPGSERGWWGDRRSFFRVYWSGGSRSARSSAAASQPVLTAHPQPTFSGYYFPRGARTLSSFNVGSPRYLQCTSNIWHAKGLSETTRNLYVRYWLVVLVTALLPVARLLRFSFKRLRAKRFRRRGGCMHCGYDLRATPGRCPECGTEPAAPAPTGLTSTGPVKSSPSNRAPGEDRPAPRDPAPPSPAADRSDPPPPARAA